MNAVSKSWAFTKNNYGDDDITFFTTWGEFAYMVFGREVAPTTGTPHLQGYFTLKKAVRGSYLKRTLPQGTHFEASRKSLLANSRYCTKCPDHTIIDRRYGRDGIPQSVTLVREEDPRVERLASQFMPRFSLKSLYPR